MIIPFLSLLFACPSQTSVPPPVQVVGVDSFGPRAGNGLQPRLAALDSRVGRLYVLNASTRNVSAVDLKHRCVLATVSLGSTWQFEERDSLVVDPVSERLFITGPEIPGFHRSHLVAISTRSLRVTATREVEGTLLSKAVLLPARHELFVSAWCNGGGGGWGIDVFDTRTLALLRRVETPSEIVEMMADPVRNRIYTAEPDTAFNNGVGTLGRWGYGSVRITARDPDTGGVLQRSHPITLLSQILVDSSHRRLFVSYSDQSRTSGMSDVVAVLDGKDLSLQRVLSFRARSGGPERRPLFTALWYDNRADLLVALLPNGAGLSALSLHSGKITTGTRVPSLPMSYPGPLDSARGTLFGMVDNGVVALGTRSLATRWRLPVGAEVSRVFADRGRGRALALIYGDETALVWAGVKRGRPTRIPVSRMDGFDQILWLDSLRRRIYYTLPTIYGSGGYLARMDYCGRPIRASAEPMPARLLHLAISSDGRKRYRGYLGFSSEEASVSVYEGNSRVREVKIPGMPQRFAYAGAADTLFLAYPGELRTLDGRAIPLPRAASHDNQPLPLDVSPDGTRVYFADPNVHLLSMLRASDGAVLAQRRLQFGPTDLSVDVAAGRAYLADRTGGRVFTVLLPLELPIRQ